MAIYSDYYRCTSLHTNQKRCFLLLLICNSLVACIYYLHQQTLSTRSTLPPIDDNFHSIDNLAVRLLRQILQREYDNADLSIFYRTTEKEFSLGLRCTRKPTPPLLSSSIIANETNNQSDSTTVR